MEHARKCGWAYNKEGNNHTGTGDNCTLLVRPSARETQGVSQWMTDIVTFHLYAIQAKCRLLFDYGPQVDLRKILIPHHAQNAWNWTVPKGFACEPPLCHVLQSHNMLEKSLGMSLAKVPIYRYAYSSQKYGGINLYYGEFEQLQRALPPGVEVEMGVACSLSTLLRLNTKEVEAFVPGVFTDILPRLNQPEKVVMALYIRTHHADIVANQEQARKQNASRVTKKESSYQDRATNIIKCALQIERQRNASRSVWIVVTDSPKLKQWIFDTYSSTNRNETREIVTTPSRGVHTRPQRAPSVSDIAEALVDWYLIGESDIVISDKESPTFGGTAALRTARLLYNAEECVPLTLVHNGRNEKMEQHKIRLQRQYLN